MKTFHMSPNSVFYHFILSVFVKLDLSIFRTCLFVETLYNDSRCKNRKKYSFDVVNYRFSQDAKQYKHNSALPFSLLLH